MSAPDEREQHDRVRERFTRSAEPYAKFALAGRTGDAEKLVSMAAPQPADVGLDLACGPGTLTRALARRVKFAYGVDLTPALLVQAQRAFREEGLTNIALACGDAVALPMRDASLDVAVCGYCFHHMNEPGRAALELARVLRPGARLGVVDLIVPAGAGAELANQIERARDRSHTRTLAATEVASLLEAAGFRIRTSEQTERARVFDDWMRISGWVPGDAAWTQTRRLMQASMAGDAAGFHPRYTGPQSEMEFVQTAFFVAAEKA